MNEKTQLLRTKAFEILFVRNFEELHSAYITSYKQLTRTARWDATKSFLSVNRIKKILEEIDPDHLNESERMWRAEILWFWYYKTICCPGWDTNLELIKHYAGKALEFQKEGHQDGMAQANRITKLLYILVHDRVDQAEEWMKVMPYGADPLEHQMGLDFIRIYKKYRCL